MTDNTGIMHIKCNRAKIIPLFVDKCVIMVSELNRNKQRHKMKRMITKEEKLQLAILVKLQSDSRDFRAFNKSTHVRPMSVLKEVK